MRDGQNRIYLSTVDSPFESFESLVTTGSLAVDDVGVRDFSKSIRLFICSYRFVISSGRAWKQSDEII